MPFKLNALTGQLDLVNASPPSSNSFSTIATPLGTSPVANAPATTLNLSSSDGTVTITGNAGTETVDIKLANAYKQENFTLLAADITNKYIVLGAAPKTATLTRLTVLGGPEQDYGVAFQILLSNHLDWNGLTLDGVLVAGDKLIVSYN